MASPRLKCTDRPGRKKLQASRPRRNIAVEDRYVLAGNGVANSSRTAGYRPKTDDRDLAGAHVCHAFRRALIDRDSGMPASHDPEVRCSDAAASNCASQVLTRLDMSESNYFVGGPNQTRNVTLADAVRNPHRS